MKKQENREESGRFHERRFGQTGRGRCRVKEGEFISAAVVTYNDGEKAETVCRQLLENTAKYPLKLYVIDNASSDGTADRLSGLDGVTLIRNAGNIGFGAAHNTVLSHGVGRVHFVINPDIEISGDVLSDMTDFMEQNPDVVMAMPRILNPDRTEQKLPKEIPTFKRLFLGRLSRLGGGFKKIREDYIWADREITEPTDIRFCSGCFFGIRGQAFEKLNGFDRRYFMYLEDADLTLRARELGRVVMAPEFTVTHLWNRESAKKIKYLMIHMASSLKFLKKWRKHPK